MYECDPIENAVKLSDWYSTCKNSCSPSAGGAKSVIDVYMDTVASAIIDSYVTLMYRTTTESHTDLLDNCRYTTYVSSVSIHDEDIDRYRNLVLNSAQSNPGNGTLVIEEPKIPECSYFRDNYLSYDTLISQKYKGQIVGGTSLENYIMKIPALGVSARYKEGAARLGTQVIYWNISSITGSQCSIMKKFSQNCRSDSAMRKWWCPSFGGSILLNQSAVNTCAGDLLPINSGIYVALSQTSPTDSTFSILNTGIKEMDSDLQQVLVLINKALSDFSGGACESICDLTDQSSSIRENTTSVIETPIGPWLAWRQSVSTPDHIYYMTSCRRISEWKLMFPLNPCPKSTGLTISDGGNGMSLWDPAQNYFIIGYKCQDFEPSDWAADIRMNRSITIYFWGKKLVISPPYSWNSSWEDSELHIHRTSKWTPYVDGVDIDSGEDMTNLLDSTHRHVDHLSRVVRVESSRNLTILSKLVNGIKDVGYTISGIGYMIRNYLVATAMFVFKIIGICVLMWVGLRISWYVIKKIYYRKTVKSKDGIVYTTPEEIISRSSAPNALQKRRGLSLDEL
jgi:hypothetical protein